MNVICDGQSLTFVVLRSHNRVSRIICRHLWLVQAIAALKTALSLPLFHLLGFGALLSDEPLNSC